MENIVTRAKAYAIGMHRKVQQTYGDNEPYEIHLSAVVEVARSFIHLIPSKGLQDKILAACWLHDTLEDCGAHVNYNSLKNRFGDQVAEMVFAVTNSKGRNPKEREDAAYYQGIRDTDYATFVKICDRIANMEYGSRNGEESRHFKSYQARCDKFCEMLWCPAYHTMIHDLRVTAKLVK